MTHAIAALTCALWASPSHAAPASYIHGVIRDRLGAAVADVSVQIYPTPNPQGFACGSAVISDQQGNYRLEVPETLTCDQRPLGARKTVYLKLSPRQESSDSDHLLGLFLEALPRAALSGGYRRDFTLPRLPPELGGCSPRLDLGATTNISGGVRGPQGLPVSGTRVVFRSSQSSQPLGWAETDARGRFRALLPQGCRDHPLSFPATLLLSLEPPPGFYAESPSVEHPLSLESAASSLSAAWGPDGWPLPFWRAARGTLCVEVELQGQPFSYGYVSLIPVSGLQPHSLFRLRDGRACFAGLSPGQYELAITPQTFGVLSPAPVTPRLTATAVFSNREVEGNRIAIDSSGRALFYPLRGAARPITDALRLRLTSASPRDPQLLSGTVRFPSGARPGEKALLLAQTVDEMRAGRDENYLLEWVDSSSGTRAFQLPIEPGRLSRLSIRGESFGALYTRMSGPGRGAADSIAVEMTRAGTITGAVLLPDGQAFKPRAGTDPERISLLAIKAVPYWYDVLSADGDYVDELGSYRLSGLAPGLYRLIPFWQGQDFSWSTGIENGVWVKPGMVLTRDITLHEPADVEVLDAPEDPAPYDGIDDGEIHFWDAHPRERWVVGLPAGVPDPALLSRLLLAQTGEAAFAFLQSTSGRWIAQSGRGHGPRTRVPPGRYDVYSYESTHRFNKPSLRITGIERGVSLAPRSLKRLRFTRGADGSARLRGTLKVSRSPALERLMTADSVSAVHSRVIPRIEVRNASGELLAAAFPPLSFEALGGIISALEKLHADDVAEYADTWPYRFEISALPEGRLQVSVIAPDRLHQQEIKFTAGEDKQLDIHW